MELKVQKLHPDARAPVYAHEGDAGMDMFTIDAVTIAPMERVQIATGIALEIPDGYVGLVWDKSGPSNLHGIKTLGGVIDAGYRGEIKIGLVNLGNVPFTFEAGHKVAQLLIQKVERPEITVADNLSDSARGTGAFGSSGK